ncbi:hypothetical protein CR513_62914, partial [Mucuna pruriens]
MALLTKTFEYVGSLLLKTKEAAARAAAVSAATSEPGVFASILNTLLGVSMSSGLSQQAWSFLASPTCKHKPTSEPQFLILKDLLRREFLIHLNINGVWMCSSFEKIIRAPANGLSGILQLSFH